MSFSLFSLLKDRIILLVFFSEKGLTVFLTHTVEITCFQLFIWGLHCLFEEFLASFLWWD